MEITLRVEKCEVLKRHKKRSLTQIESLEIDLHIYGYFIYDRGSTTQE